jgi:hypothetical protein
MLPFFEGYLSMFALAFRSKNRRQLINMPRKSKKATKNW